jgi:D-aminopeptidase
MIGERPARPPGRVGRYAGAVRARDLGIVIGSGRPGPLGAITDVPGVRVGHRTLVHGDGPLVRGLGPVRTGVTVIVPHDDDPWTEPVFAGAHQLNGNGELTGLDWIRESGLLSGPIGLTNTHSVGVVRDALVRAQIEGRPPGSVSWALPVVGETWDGRLNDIDGFHVTTDDALAALRSAAPGPVAEGGVGGGTGMVCHEFKGGIGTSSRVVAPELGGWTLGVLVQANYGRRERLSIDGVAVGAAIPIDVVPSPARPGSPRAGSGSIIVILATDAPLLPHQCARVAQRAALGIGRVGGTGATSSGDLILAFATGNRGLPDPAPGADSRTTIDGLRMVLDPTLDALFDATIEATEEAIVNALVAAETMIGRDGITAFALPHDRLVAAMAAAGRLHRAP